MRNTKFTGLTVQIISNCHMSQFPIFHCTFARKISDQTGQEGAEPGHEAVSRVVDSVRQISQWSDVKRSDRQYFTR